MKAPEEPGYRFLNLGEPTRETDEFWCMVDYSSKEDGVRHNKYRFEWRLLDKYGHREVPIFKRDIVQIRRKTSS